MSAQLWCNWILLGIQTWRDVSLRNYEISDFLERHRSWRFGPRSERWTLRVFVCVCVCVWWAVPANTVSHLLDKALICVTQRGIMGVLGGKKGTWNSPLEPNDWQFTEFVCVFLCVCVFISATKEGFFMLHMVLTVRRNYVIYTCLVLLCLQGTNLSVNPSLPQAATGLMWTSWFRFHYTRL